MRTCILPGLIALLCCWSGIASADPIRIGVLTDLSGPMVSFGRQTRLGAEIAAEEILRKGGEVELVFGDHQLQARNAVKEFQKLTGVDYIDALYSEFTPTTIALAPLLNRTRLPTIYTAAAASPLEVSPFLFKSYMDYAEGCRMIAALWRSNGIERVAILRPTPEFGILCEEGLRKVYQNPMVVTYNPGEDVTPQVLLLKERGIQAVLNATFEPDFHRMLKSLYTLDYRPFVGTDEDAVTGEVRAQYPNIDEFVTLFALPPLSDDLLARVRAKEPDNDLVSISAAGLAYLHIRQLYAACRGCAKGDFECAFSKLANAPAEEPLGFRGWRNRIADISLRLTGWTKRGKTREG